jgi:glucose-6-phosphate isomerase
MAISVHLSNARSFLDPQRLQTNEDLARQSLEWVKTKQGIGHEWLGWWDLVEEPNDALLEQIDVWASKIRAEADVLVVIGIGGSYLGAKAVMDALRHPFTQQGPEILFAGHHMSDRYHADLLAYLRQPKPDGTTKSVYVNVISKSGTTLEPALAFRLIRSFMEDQYGAEASQRILVTTSPNSGALNKLVEQQGYPKFVIPDSVGGRFSVLTPVGLLPLAVCGINIQSFFYGAVDQHQRLLENPEALLAHAAHRKSLYEAGYAIDIIATFDPELSSMGAWLQQLLGESEGKQALGLYPAVHTYSTDLHSLGQWVQEGPRNILETFLSVTDPGTATTVPSDPTNDDGLNYLSGRTLKEINQIALIGTQQAHLEGGVPIIEIQIPSLNEMHLGAFMYYFELFTAVYVYSLGVNPFDQPGVEAYKQAMFRLLGKP